MRRRFATAFAALLGACDSPPAPPAPEPGRAPVVVIGLDGATLREAGPLLDRGELPALRALRDRGVHGVLRSFPPGASPLVWTTIVTGVSPARHGIEGFLSRLPGRPISSVVSSVDRKVPALWNVASDAGLDVGVVGWWATWPAETVRGFVVADTLIKTGERLDGTHPPDLVKRLPAFARGGLAPDAALAEILGAPPNVACPRLLPGESDPDLPSPPEGSRDRNVCAALRRDLATTEIARSLMTEERPDVLFVYLKGIDTISHVFWKFAHADAGPWRLPPRPEEIARYRGVVSSYYRLTDRLVGRLVEAAGDATVLVVSDHGFRADPDCGGAIFQYNQLLADLGYLVGPEPRIDWSKTIVSHDAPAFAIAGSLYLNLEERSPLGIVPRAQYDSRLGEIESRLRALRTERGRPLFDRIERPEPGPERWRNPDLRVRPAPDLDAADALRIGARRVPLGAYLRERDVSGAHSADAPADLEGIVFAAGRGIARRLAPVRSSVYDVAPTLACLLGLRLTVRPEGEPAQTILSRRGMESCGGWVETPASPPRVLEPHSPFPDDERLREELRALGYVD